MSIDQDTRATRAIIFDKEGNLKWSAEKEIEQIYPQAGWVEHDANNIWIRTLQVIASVLIESGLKPHEIDSIGIANQRETTVIWDKKTGLPIHNAIVWQSEQTNEIAEELVEAGHQELVQEKTGLVINSYFSATKIIWLLDHVEGAREAAEKGELLFGTIDSWLLWKLTGGKVHATDYTNASRTMLYNIYDLEWDQEILDLLNIPASLLPEVRSSSEVYGHTTPAHFYGESIPVAGMAGDQHASLVGQAAFREGMVKTTYSTGAFIMMNTGTTPVKSENGLLTTIAYGLKGEVTYALEGSIFVAGIANDWLTDEMRLAREPEDLERYAERVDTTDNVYLVPAFSGLGAPHWDPNARGAILGLTRGSSKEQFIRAGLESIAYQTRDVLNTMVEDAGIDIPTLRVHGGVARNNFLMQFQADILGKKIERSKIEETTALGAAYLAGLASGFWKDVEEVEAYWETDGEFKPEMSEDKREDLYAGWQDAVKATQVFKHRPKK